jgi:hypothetical protein
MQSHEGHNNAKTLFGLSEIPSDPQIRNVLDKTEVEPLFNVFTWVFQSLEQGGWLKRYKFLESQYLIALDGTTYFSSSKIHCSQCNHRTHQNGKTSYFHSAILPVIVSPDQSEVISLAPEFMTPQDGHEKQDCEVAGAKRWIDLHKQDFNVDSVTLLGDDLYSRQPMCETVLSRRAKLNVI